MTYIASLSSSCQSHQHRITSPHLISSCYHSPTPPFCYYAFLSATHTPQYHPLAFHLFPTSQPHTTWSIPCGRKPPGLTCCAAIVNILPPLHRAVPAVVRTRRPPRYHTSVAHTLWYYPPPFSYPTSSVTFHPPPTSHLGAVVYMHIPTTSYSYTPCPLIYSCSH